MTSLSNALGGQKKEQLFGVGSASLAGVRSGQLFIYSTENEFLCAQCLVGAGGPVGNVRGAALDLMLLMVQGWDRPSVCPANKHLIIGT